MKIRVLFMFATAGLAAGSLVAETSSAAPVSHAAFGKPAAAGKEAKGAKAAKKVGPSEVTKKIAFRPKELRFGMSLEEISKVYDKVFEADFLPLYRRVEPGPRMNELDNELADKKQLVKRNHIEFSNLPSGLENTPLGGEFTYNNGESMTHVTLRNGTKRYFFFFKNRLWKIYDETALSKKSKLGTNYEGVLESLGKLFGKKAREQEADPAAKRMFDSGEWADKETILRVLNRGGKNVALVYIDRKVEENLDQMRPNKGEKPREIDATVSSVTKGGPMDNKPGAPEEGKGKKKDKKDKKKEAKKEE